MSTDAPAPAPAPAPPPSLLLTRGLAASYGDFQALFGIDFEIHVGEIVALVGANGAGKSTFLKAVCGVLPAPPPSVVFEGRPIGGLPPGQIVRQGIAMVPEGRRLFPSLSVEENLQMGACARRVGPWDLGAVYGLFPELEAKRRAGAGTLSGGQQQMVAIGRALMTNPKLLLCDELSLGLAPIVVRELYVALARLCQAGLTALVVEQDVATAQRVSSRLYCLQEGRVTLCGESRTLGRARISEAYFGV